ncbi:MAG: CDP-glycerol glycerophosphotransferase family protein, partial [Candidatus Syntrophosphaera sp.]
PDLVFYCGQMIDHHCFDPVRKHLPEVTYATSNPALKRELDRLGIVAKRLPVFPRAVIMCRHATHRFPCDKITKIGLRHGAYHFKRLTGADNYNRFDLYLFTSRADLQAAETIGVKTGMAVGFPRLDPAFDGSITEEDLSRLRKELKLDPARPVLLFTATWEKSGMSAIHLWYDRLSELTSRYDILVTAHPWTGRKYLEKIEATPGVRLLREVDLTPHLMLADVVIGDTSSLLGDCSALGRPIVTFKTGKAPRSLEEIDRLLDLFSLRVTSFAQVPAAVERLLEDPRLLEQGRREANRIMFDALDGKAGQRAAAEILKILPQGMKP